MASAIALNLRRILSHFDIPKFSDDLRLIILDYMYYRHTHKMTRNESNCWFRVGPHLINDQLCLQIMFYTDTESHIVSSFGLYCENLAIVYYNNISRIFHLSDTNPLDWHNLISQVMARSYYVFYAVYAFCHNDQSTIKITMVVEKTIKISRVNFDSITNGDAHIERIYTSRYSFENIEDIKECIEIYHNMASILGLQKNEYSSAEHLLFSHKR